MENLTEEQRLQIALEVWQKQPANHICTLALLKMGEAAVMSNAPVAEFESKANINGKIYALKMVVTHQEIKP